MIGYILYFLGGALFLAGVAIALMNYSFLARAESVKGEVVDWNDSGSSEESGSELSTAVIRFQTLNGEQIEFKALEYAWMGFDPINVPVVYDPQNPKRARVKKFFNMHLLPTSLIVGGGLLFIGGLVPTLVLALFQK